MVQSVERPDTKGGGGLQVAMGALVVCLVVSPFTCLSRCLHKVPQLFFCVSVPYQSQSFFAHRACSSVACEEGGSIDSSWDEARSGPLRARQLPHRPRWRPACRDPVPNCAASDSPPDYCTCTQPGTTCSACEAVNRCDSLARGCARSSLWAKGAAAVPLARRRRPGW